MRRRGVPWRGGHRSIVGAGAAVVAGRCCGSHWFAICGGALPGLLAPWLLIVPFLLCAVLSGFGGEIILLLVLGILLSWAAHQALGAVLRPHAWFWAGMGFTLAMYVFGSLEAFAVAGIIDLMETSGSVGTVVLHIYLGSAAVVAVAVGTLMLLIRTREGQTLIKVMTGVPPRRQGGEPAGGGGNAS
ncbi:MAG: hypothetical protein Q4D89_03595 [Arachnia propionica]|uniref:hypothetical protein n=1 Tax=Arachnia propionica TaxID=1750 RepID=UPI0026FC2528|nr:hypothetical protein [Arachnia propionica]